MVGDDTSEGLGELGVLVEVDDEGSLANSVSVSTKFALTGSQGFGIDDFLDIFEGSEALEEGDSITGLLIGLELILNNEGDLRHL